MARTSIEKIWVVGGQSDGYSGSTLLYKNKKKKRKKQLVTLRPLERAIRMGSKSGEKLFTTYSEKHNKSNRKKRNGWVTDLPMNAIRANTKAIRAFEVPRILGM